MTSTLADRVLAGDTRAIARGISVIEDERPEGEALVRAIFGRTGRAYLMGVTGPPGAGKSTLVDRVAAAVRAEGRTVGILAVDPTSPFTGGAVLGDRIRMQAHSGDEGVFIRSMATRGHLGGLARATSDAALVLDAAGKDVIVIETVGVGQDEVDIVGTADVSVVVLVPGTGDEVQALKAGIMEIADVFVVNKSDRDGADRLVSAIEANLALHTYGPDEWRPPIVQTTATSGRGIPELMQSIEQFRAHSQTSHARKRRARDERRLRDLLSRRFVEHVERDVLRPGELPDLVDRIAARTLDPVQRGGQLAGSGFGTFMKAILDHVGIAIRDLPAVLAFYRDAFGFEIVESEDVVSQRVRAHFMPVGEPKLEFLETTTPDSAIAKYLDKKGPGLHHLAFRVEDIHAALAQLKSLGVRLIDEQPRPGAEHALVAFIHPSAAHGVLVELKQAAPAGRRFSVTRHQIGELELISVCDGFFALDGGSMFGIVPKTMWSKKAPADDRNRITLAMRPLVVRGVRTMIIDAGLGDKEGEKFNDLYAVDRARHLDHSLAEAGLSVDDIDIVLATHLHFDHAGGFTVRDARGRLVPRFPRAQYVVRRGEWEAAMHPNVRTRGSYLLDNYAPLAEAGVLLLVDDDQTIMPGVKVRRTGGHTKDHQMALIESGGQAAAFVADLIPTTAHAPDPWILGYDLYPLETLAAKHAFVAEAIARNMLVFFEHDPLIPSGFIVEEDGKRSVRPTL